MDDPAVAAGKPEEEGRCHTADPDHGREQDSPSLFSNSNLRTACQHWQPLPISTLLGQ